MSSSHEQPNTTDTGERLCLQYVFKYTYIYNCLVNIYLSLAVVISSSLQLLTTSCGSVFQFLRVDLPSFFSTFSIPIFCMPSLVVYSSDVALALKSILLHSVCYIFKSYSFLYLFIPYAIWFRYTRLSSHEVYFYRLNSASIP